MADDNAAGQQDPSSTSSEYNVLEFIVQQILGRVSTMKLVKVISVTTTGEVAAVGFVDVQPMVNMYDGAEKSTQHGTIHNVPYTRIQGGKNAIILDPQKDDIGWMACADRDISAVKQNKAISNPGSFRMFDIADGVYMGGLLNGVPENFIQFTNDGKINITSKSDITLKSDTKVVVNAPTFEIDGNIIVSGTWSPKTGTEINFGGNTLVAADLKSGSLTFTTHKHLGVTTGGGTSGGPTT
jgi:hypothetical protein